MKILIVTILLWFSVPALSQPTESVELLNALVNNFSDFSKLLKKSEKILISQAKMEIVDENKVLFKIYAKKLRQGDILEGDVFWEIEKTTISQSDGPDKVKYESRITHL